MSTLPELDAGTLLEDYEIAMRLGFPERGALRDEVVRRLEVGRRVPSEPALSMADAIEALVSLVHTGGGAEHRRRVTEAKAAIVRAAEDHCARALAYAIDVDRPLTWNEALATASLLRAELDATLAEMEGMLDAQKPVGLVADVEPDQLRPRLALVPDDDPALEDAPAALLEAVKRVPGVEHVSVDPLDSDPSMFVLCVRGGNDLDVARAVLRTLPDGTMTTAGNTRIEVDGQAVWFHRPRGGVKSPDIG